MAEGRRPVIKRVVGPLELGDQSRPATCQEFARRVDEALRSLPPITRQVFELHRFDEKGLVEIAEELGLDVRVVEKHLAAALVRLHAVIRGQG